MTVRRLDHVGIVVNDLAAATAFFEELGLVSQGAGSVGGRWVDNVVGLESVEADLAMMQTPDGTARVELVKFHSPQSVGEHPREPANTPGLRHLSFAVEDIDATIAGLRSHGGELVGRLERYENSYLLCYMRGPAGIIIELAQPLS